jgi:hypothetical protein
MLNAKFIDETLVHRAKDEKPPITMKRSIEIK